MKDLEVKFDRNSADKLTDRLFVQSIAISIICIVMCMIALCSMTYAWFNDGVSGGNNVLTAGRFDLSVTVTDSYGNRFDAFTDVDGSSYYRLERIDNYSVPLEMTSDTTVEKGFCSVDANGVAYKTASIKKTDPSFSFIVKTESSDTILTFDAAWGLPAEVNIRVGDTLTVGASLGTGE